MSQYLMSLGVLYDHLPVPEEMLEAPE